MGPRKSVRITTPRTGKVHAKHVSHFDITSASRNSIAAYSLRPLEVLRRRLSLSKLKNACDRISTPRRKSSKPRTVTGREKLVFRISPERVRRVSEGNLKTTKVVRLQEPFDYSQTERRVSDVKPTVRQIQNRSIDEEMLSPTSSNAPSPHGILDFIERKKLSLTPQNLRTDVFIKNEVTATSENIHTMPEAVNSMILTGLTANENGGEPATPELNERNRRSRTRSLNNSVFLTPMAVSDDCRGVLGDISAIKVSKPSCDSALTPYSLEKGVKIFAQVQGQMIPLRINKMNKQALLASVKEATKKPGVQLNKAAIAATPKFVKSLKPQPKENRHKVLSTKKAPTTSRNTLAVSCMSTISSKKLMKPQEKFYNGKLMLSRINPPKEFKTPTTIQRYRRHTLASAAKIKLSGSISSSSVTIVNTPMSQVGGLEQSKIPNMGTSHLKRW